MCAINEADVTIGQRGDLPAPSLPVEMLEQRFDECPFDLYAMNEDNDHDDGFVNPWANLVTEEDFKQAQAAFGTMEEWEVPGVCMTSWTNRRSLKTLNYSLPT